MTEDEARRVLTAYRGSRPRVLPAVVALAGVGVPQKDIAEMAGVTAAAVSVMLRRHRARVSAGWPGATCGNVAPPATLDVGSRVAQP